MPRYKRQMNSYLNLGVFYVFLPDLCKNPALNNSYTLPVITTFYHCFLPLCRVTDLVTTLCSLLLTVWSARTCLVPPMTQLSALVLCSKYKIYLVHQKWICFLCSYWKIYFNENICVQISALALLIIPICIQFSPLPAQRLHEEFLFQTRGFPKLV